MTLEDLEKYLMSEINSLSRRTEEHFLALEKGVDKTFESSQKAIDKAETSQGTRFESFNEFNQRIDTILANTATRDSLQAVSEKLMAEINRNRDDLSSLEKRLDKKDGQSEGSQITIGKMVTLISVVSIILGIVIVVANNF